MKTIYAEAQPGKVVLKEKEIPAPGKGEVLLKAKYSAMSPGTENGLQSISDFHPNGRSNQTADPDRCQDVGDW